MNCVKTTEICDGVIGGITTMKPQNIKYFTIYIPKKDITINVPEQDFKPLKKHISQINEKVKITIIKQLIRNEEGSFVEDYSPAKVEIVANPTLLTKFDILDV